MKFENNNKLKVDSFFNVSKKMRTAHFELSYKFIDFFLFLIEFGINLKRFAEIYLWKLL